MEYCTYKQHPGTYRWCGNLVRAGELYCYAHQPAKIAERKRAKALAKAAPALRLALSDIVNYLLAEPTQTVVPDGRIRDAQAAIAEAEKEA